MRTVGVLVLATVAVVLSACGAAGVQTCSLPPQMPPSLVNRTLRAPPPAPASSSVLDEAWGTGIADFSGDGLLDIVITAFTKTSAFWWRNGGNDINGVPQYGDFIELPLGGTGNSNVYTGLIDNDAMPDFAVATTSGRSPIVGPVVVMFNNANGASWTKVEIGLALTPPEGLRANRIAIVDLDGDGDSDFVVGSYLRNTVYLIVHTAPRSFATPTLIATNTEITCDVVVAHLDGDSFFDIITTTGNSGPVLDVNVHLSTSATTWAAPTSISSLPSITAAFVQCISGYVDAADLDGDGDADVANALVSSTSRVYVYLNDGTGAFPVQLDFASGSNFHTIHLVDINGDGAVDVAGGSLSPNGEVYVLYNLLVPGDPSSFAFGPTVLLASGVDSNRQSAVGDVNNDLRPDLLLTSKDEDEVWLVLNSAVGAGSTQIVDTTTSSRIAAVDVDADGDLDLAVATLTPLTIAYYENNNGEASFSAAAQLFPLPDYSTTPRVHEFCHFDFNRDGTEDWFVLYGPSSYSVESRLVAFLSSASATIAVAAQQVVPGYAPVVELTGGTVAGLGPLRFFGAMVCADLDGDGNVDIVVSDATDAQPYWILNTDSTIAGLTAHPGPATRNGGTASNAAAFGTDSLRIGDVTGDGILDLVYGSAAYGNLTWILGTGVAGPSLFTTPTQLSTETVVPSGYQGLADFALADLDNDGDLDIVLADACCVSFVAPPSTRSFINDGFGSFTPAVFYTGITFKTAVVATDISDDSFVDILISSRQLNAVVAFFNSQSAPGTFVGPVTITDTIGDVGSLLLIDVSGNGVTDIVGSASQVLSSPTFVVERATPFARFPLAPSQVTVDTAACGFSLWCVAKSVAAAPRCGPQTILLPTGTYTGCYTIAPQVVSKSITIQPATPGARVLFDCGAAGGVLFHVIKNGDLTLRNIDVRASSQAPRSAFATNALRVSDGGAATLDSVSFTDSFPSPASAYPITTLLQGGLGGVATVESRASLTVTACNFTSTRALVSGGAIAVLGESPTLTVTASRFTGTSAASFGGAVHINAIDATVSFADTTFAGNSAFAGGAVYAASPVAATFTSCTFTANSAVWGGAVALSPDAPTRYASIGALVDIVPASGPPPPEVLTLTSCTLTANSAVYGGSFAGCLHPVAFSGTTIFSSTASRCGGAVFTCPPASTAGLPYASADVPSVPWLSGGAPSGTSISAGIFGQAVCSSPVTYTWSPPLAGLVPAGIPFTTTLVVADAFGQAVVDPLSSVELTIPAIDAPRLPGDFVFQEGDSNVELASLNTIFPTLTVMPTFIVASASDLGSNITLRAGGSSAGAAFFTDTTLNITACPINVGGTISPLGRFRCEVCSETSGSDSYSIDPCFACERGQFNDASTGLCTTCPTLTVQVVDALGNETAASLLLLCQCVVGAYTPLFVTGVPCLPCPDGGVCVGGTVRPVAAEGFFDVSDDEGIKFARCPRAKACSGGLRQCNTGYKGFMCRECIDNYYSDSNKECTECPNSAVANLAVFFLILIILAAVVVGLAAYAHVQFDTEDDVRKSQRQRKIPHSFTLAIVFFQILGMVANQQFNWPTPVQESLGAANVLNLDLNIFASECALTSFDGKYLVSILYPLLFLAAVIVALFLFKIIRSSFAWFADSFADIPLIQLLERVIFLTFSLLYIPLSRSSLILFDCVKLPDGKYYLDQELGRRCYDSSWFTLLPWGIFAVLIYVVALPVYFGVTLIRNRKQLFVPSVLARYGSIYRLYRVKYFYFELVQLAKRLVVVLCSLFVSNHQTWLVFLLVTVLLTSAFCQLHFEPYYHPIYNTLEIQLSVIISAILLLGFAFYADLFARAWSRTAFIVITMTVVVAAIVLIVATMVVEIRSILSQVVGEASFIEDVRVKRFWKVVEDEAPDWADPALKHSLFEIREHFLADEMASKAEFDRRRNSDAGPWGGAPTGIADDVDQGILLGDVDSGVFLAE